MKLLLSTIFSMAFLLVFSVHVYTKQNVEIEPRIKARITSLRRGELVELRFSQKPVKKKYFIYENDEVLGIISILKAEKSSHGSTYEVLARYSLRKKEYLSLIRAGTAIVLLERPGLKKSDYSHPPFLEPENFAKRITHPADGKEMVLIKEGKFILGSNSGEADETPQQVLFLDDFYMDKFEVTNREYKRFIIITKKDPPISWKGAMYKKGTGNHPVLVTYREAELYAQWAGKRLPTEKEWEKAARGSVKGSIPGRVYPWGNDFIVDGANTIEFWKDSKSTKGLKGMLIKNYRITAPGPLPVSLFAGTDLSPYGVAGMAGNLMEWTSSWYRAYKGSTLKEKRFGTLYKVIRGGSWYTSSRQSRITNRQIGGIPNLSRDAIAGFRCVKDVDPMDEKRAGSVK